MGQGADIGSGAACDANVRVRDFLISLRGFEAQNVKRVERASAWFALDFDSFARELVQRFSVLLFRRVHRRNLKVRLFRIAERDFAKLLERLRQNFASLIDFGSRIARNRTFAEAHAAVVNFVRAQEVARKLNAAADADHEQACCERVERSAVAHLRKLAAFTAQVSEQKLLKLLDQSKRAHARVFIDQQRATFFDPGAVQDGFGARVHWGGHAFSLARCFARLLCRLFRVARRTRLRATAWRRFLRLFAIKAGRSSGSCGSHFRSDAFRSGWQRGWIQSRCSGRGRAGCGIAWIDLLEKFVHAARIFEAFVFFENKVGNRADAENAGEMAAKETFRAVQALEAFLHLLFVNPFFFFALVFRSGKVDAKAAEQSDKHGCHACIWGDFYGCESDGWDARVFDIARNYVGEFLLDDGLEAGSAGRLHRTVLLSEKQPRVLLAMQGVIV